jgi:hypothetical protein
MTRRSGPQAGTQATAGPGQRGSRYPGLHTLLNARSLSVAC